MPKKITKWQCVNCNREFSSEQKCIAHEKREYDIERANEMLKGGDTLKEINNKFDFWKLPKHLESVTMHNYFKILSRQHYNKLYKIASLELTGYDNTVFIALRNDDNLNGYCDKDFDVSSINEIDGTENLFVFKGCLYDKSYAQRLKMLNEKERKDIYY